MVFSSSIAESIKNEAVFYGAASLFKGTCRATSYILARCMWLQSPSVFIGCLSDLPHCSQAPGGCALVLNPVISWGVSSAITRRLGEPSLWPSDSSDKTRCAAKPPKLYPLNS